MKVCYICKVPKELSEFYNDRTRVDGKGTKCKSCAKAFAKRIEVFDVVDEKFCTRCEKKKPSTQFHKNKSRLDGLQDACKKCRSLYKKDCKLFVNRAKELETRRRWRKENPLVVKAQASARRRREYSAIGSHTEQEWVEKLTNTPYCCYCGKMAETKDHVVPLSKGGTDFIDNIVPACRSCNCAKGASSVTEFIAKRSFDYSGVA